MSKEKQNNISHRNSVPPEQIVSDLAPEQIDKELYYSTGLDQKAKLASIRDELGFNNLQNSAYKDFVEYSQSVGVTLDFNTAYTQSQVYQKKLNEGLSCEEAYLASEREVKEMLGRGHSYESIVLEQRSGLAEAQRDWEDWLKTYGTVPKEESFSMGQRNGEGVETGNVINTRSKEVAQHFSMRQRDRNAGGYNVVTPYSREVMRSILGDASNYRTQGVQAQDVRGGQIATMVAERTGRFSLAFVKGSARMASMAMYQYSGDGARGLQSVRNAKETINVVWWTIGASIANKSRQILNMPLQLELRGMLEKFGVQSMEELIQKGNVSLRKVGLDPVNSRLKGRQLTMMASQRIREIRKKIKSSGETAILLDALEKSIRLRKAGRLSTFATKPRSFRLSTRMLRISSLSMRKIARAGGEGGQGLGIAMNYTRYIMMGGKSFYRAGKMAAKVSLAAVTSVVTLSGKAAAKVGGSLAQKASPKIVRVGRGLTRYGEGVTKLTQARERLQRRARQPLRSRIKTKVKRKVELAIRNIAQKLAGRSRVARGTIRVVSSVFSGVSKAAAAISNALAAAGKYLIIAGGAAAAIVILIMIVGSVVSALISLFDFSSYQTTVQEYIVQTVEDCYTEDMNKILELTEAKNYQNVSIDRDDSFRDTIEYTAKKEEFGADAFTQSSNCAEIICMTLVRFGFDVEGADDAISGHTKNDISQYIRELWYGSHEIYCHEYTTTSQVQSGTDANGNPVYETVTSTSMTIVYRTYYFNYLFDDSAITMGRGATPVIYGNTGSGGAYGYVLGEDSIYAMLRDAGYSHAGACGIMGNIQQESSFNPLSEGNFYGLIQWDDTGEAALQDYCINNGLDYTTSTGQMNFLLADLEHGLAGNMNYSDLTSLLKGEEYANDPKACASFFCVGYERCTIDDPQRGDPYEYWDVYDSVYSDHDEIFQELNERIIYAQNFAIIYAPYAEDWSGLVSTGEEIVEYALQYVGRIHYTRGSSVPGQVGERYLGANLDEALYTGGTPTIGTDCSGFVYGVYKHFGIPVPTYSGAYQTSGATQIPVDESQLLPGDILWRQGHVAIYIGGGMCVEASQCNGGDHSRDLKTDSIYNGTAFTKAYRYWK